MTQGGSTQSGYATPVPFVGMSTGGGVNGHSTNNTPGTDRVGMDPLLDSPFFKGHRSKVSCVYI